MTQREKKLLRIARYWKDRSINEMARVGLIRFCHDSSHSTPEPYDPFRKPAERTAQREEALRRKNG